MRPRKPNWSIEQKLLLVQLVKARREGLLTGRHSCRETATTRRWAWDEIAEEISNAHPDVPRTGKECERHWFIEQAKAREALVTNRTAAVSNPVTKLVLDILSLQKKDINTDRIDEDSSSYQEEEDEDMDVKFIPNAVTPLINIDLPVNHTNNDSEGIPPVSPPCPESPSTEKRDLEMSVLRRQERVLKLQEEYYSLKIKHLKARMLMDL